MKRRQWTILEACRDPNLFGRHFRDPETFKGWFAFLAALFALPMTDAEREFYKTCTGRTEPPVEPLTEAWLICGRRAGKSFMLALISVFLACFRSYEEYLGPGERAMVLVLAMDRKQARSIFRFCHGLLTKTPLLKTKIVRETQEALDLSNGVSIEITTASQSTTRGYTIVAALCDEISRWPTDDDANPDYAILDALRPGMATIPNAMLLCASSPHGRRGAMWDAHRRYFGKDGEDVLVWQADTRTMNPTVPASVIAKAYERDAAWAAAEFGAQFRTDLEAYVNRDVVMACVDEGVVERPPVRGVNYFAFIDPAGGSGQDSMTLAIGHRDRDLRILDCVREIRPPFSPAQAVEQFVGVLNTYGIRKVTEDRFGGLFVREPFQTRSVTYDLAKLVKGDIYMNSVPLLNSGQVRLVNNKRLIEQLCGLERRTVRGGRESIDHAPGSHDDVCNAVMGCLLLGRKLNDLRYVDGSIEGDDITYANRWEKWREYQQQHPEIYGRPGGSACWRPKGGKTKLAVERPIVLP